MGVGDLLERLHGVYTRNYGEWVSCCPCCAEPRHTVLIREDSEGAVSVHCLRGCAPSAIVAAVGLSTALLFPRKHRRHHAPDPAWWTQPRRYPLKG